MKYHVLIFLSLIAHLYMILPGNNLVKYHVLMTNKFIEDGCKWDTWLYMATHGYALGYKCLHIVTYGYARLHMVTYGYTWLTSLIYKAVISSVLS